MNLLVAGSTSSQPAFVPPPNYLSLILTLSIHPKLNTKAKRPDLLAASNLAFQYLNALKKTVGPCNASLAEAFAFNHAYSSSRRAGSSISRRKQVDLSPHSRLDFEDAIHTDLAQFASIFSCADDFWTAIGFAFNCSVVPAYKKRWERWKLWLEYMISVLEDDWAMVETEDEESDSKEGMKESLLAKYVSIKAGERRIMRAIFADGSSKRLNEFPELWKGECRERRANNGATPGPKKKAKVDIEEAECGEYMLSSPSSSDEEDLDTSEDLPTSPPQTASAQTSITATSKLSAFPPSIELGPPSAITLRMRLVALLSSLSSSIPDSFCSLATLYDLFLSQIRPLPLPTFIILLSPGALAPFALDAADTASSVVQYIARSLLEPAAPATPNLDELDWAIVARAYAPWAAAGVGSGGVVGENGKVSACVEALVGMLGREVGIPFLASDCGSQGSGSQGGENIPREDVWEAIERGCGRRLERARTGGKRNRKGEAGSERNFEEERAVELAFLQGARVRMGVLLGMV